ncbi:hypothetical protein PCE1_001316 [Barthelona sp. PCE]
MNLNALFSNAYDPLDVPDVMGDMNYDSGAANPMEVPDFGANNSFTLKPPSPNQHLTPPTHFSAHTINQPMQHFQPPQSTHQMQPILEASPYQVSPQVVSTSNTYNNLLKQQAQFGSHLPAHSGQVISSPAQGNVYMMNAPGNMMNSPMNAAMFQNLLQQQQQMSGNGNQSKIIIMHVPVQMYNNQVPAEKLYDKEERKKNQLPSVRNRKKRNQQSRKKIEEFLKADVPSGKEIRRSKNSMRKSIIAKKRKRGKNGRFLKEVESIVLNSVEEDTLKNGVDSVELLADEVRGTVVNESGEEVQPEFKLSI